jgi:hypothetical protein
MGSMWAFVWWSGEKRLEEDLGEIGGHSMCVSLGVNRR